MSRRTKVVAVAVVAAAVLVVAGLAAWWFLRDDAPEAVSLESAVAGIEAAGTDADDSTDTAPSSASTDDSTDTAPSPDSDSGDAGDNGDSASSASTDDSTDTASSPDGDSGEGDPVSAAGDSEGTATVSSAADETVSTTNLAGVWTVQAAEDAGDLQGEPAVSFAGFRVNEVLNSVGDFTAVGRTADVSGSIELTGTALVAATVEVNMATLRTDSSFRDGRIYGALNTDAYPTATFTLVEPVELPAGVAEGEPLSGSAQGDLTIKGVTNRVTLSLSAQLVGDTIVTVGSSDVTFSDYGVTAPTAPIVVSVEDHGIMEFQLYFTR